MTSTGWATLLLTCLTALSAAAQERGVVVYRDQSGQEVGLYEQSHALLIGVSDYTAGWPDLESVPRELKKVEEALVQNGFHVVTYVNPTGSELRHEIETFINRYGRQSGNRLLFYFSGHGHTLEKGYQREMGYIVPADAPDPKRDRNGFLATAVSMNQILTWAREIDAKHALFLFDSCFSGAVFKAKDLPGTPALISALTDEPVREFITAGSAGESVPAQSVFTPAFVQALKFGLGDLDKDGFITGIELGFYLQGKVSKHADQTPQYGKIRDFALSQGDFVFVLPEAAPSPGPTGMPATAGDKRAEDTQQSERARLTVRSNVLGDTVYIDGEARGPTGPGAHELAPGTHTVRVEKPGYAAWERRVVLAAGGRETVRAELVRAVLPAAPGVVSQTSRPAVVAPGAAAVSGPRAGEISIEPELVRIRGDCFQMGSPEKEDGRDTGERQHRVCVEDFELGRHEVRVGEFRAFVEANGYRTETERGEGCWYYDGKWKHDADKSWRSPGFEQGGTHPVVCVSWNDAQAYIAWLNSRTAGDYRLPTEAEWEYAARARTQTSRYWGDDPDRDRACDYANVADEQYWSGEVFKCRDGYRYTAPVGQKRPNRYGLDDMLGNVWEWTCSAYEAAYGGEEKRCAAEGALRVLRGGSWNSDPRFVRAAHRHGYRPGYRDNSLGFRLARTP